MSHSETSPEIRVKTTCSIVNSQLQVTPVSHDLIYVHPVDEFPSFNSLKDIVLLSLTNHQAYRMVKEYRHKNPIGLIKVGELNYLINSASKTATARFSIPDLKPTSIFFRPIIHPQYETYCVEVKFDFYPVDVPVPTYGMVFSYSQIDESHCDFKELIPPQ
jgi:hypothetical protein